MSLEWLVKGTSTVWAKHQEKSEDGERQAACLSIAGSGTLAAADLANVGPSVHREDLRTKESKQPSPPGEKEIDAREKARLPCDLESRSRPRIRRLRDSL